MTATRATWSATAATRRMRAGRAARASPCSSSSTTRKAARTACCTATPASETFLSEIVGAQAYDGRHMSMESMYEYGSRAGVWRILREFDARELPLTVFGVGMALRAPPRAASARSCAAATRSPATACAGSTTRTCPRRSSASTWRAATAAHARADRRRSGRSAGTPAATARTRAAWSSSTAATSTTATTTATTCRSGPRSRRATARRRRTWSCPTRSTPTTCASSQAQGFNTGEHFFTYLRDSFDVLYAEGDPDGLDRPKMMSIGMHCRLLGKPGPDRRAAALPRPRRSRTTRVWVARRIDIARHWRDDSTPSAAGRRVARELRSARPAFERNDHAISTPTARRCLRLGAAGAAAARPRPPGPPSPTSRSASS